jgi:hypothetical protein
MKLVRQIKMCLNETYITFDVVKHLSDNVLIQNGLEQLLFNLAKVQETQVGLKLNCKYQLRANADDMNLLGDNVDTTEKIQ